MPGARRQRSGRQERNCESASHRDRRRRFHRVTPGGSAPGRGGRGDRGGQIRSLLPSGRQGVKPGLGRPELSFPLDRTKHSRRRRCETPGGPEPPRRDCSRGRPAGVRPSIENPGLYADVNVLGTVHWLEAAARLEPRPRFVYASSSSVYGDRTDAPFRETDPVDLPVSPYAATKKACELLAFTFHHLHGLPVTGLRFFTAFGPSLEMPNRCCRGAWDRVNSFE